MKMTLCYFNMLSFNTIASIITKIKRNPVIIDMKVEIIPKSLKPFMTVDTISTVTRIAKNRTPILSISIRSSIAVFVI